MRISNGVAEEDVEQLLASEERTERESVQSGMRPAPTFDARIEAALAASERTESTLADLSRTVKFLTATIGTVRDANTALARELESLAAGVMGERARLLSEHDAFIAMLVAEHERERDELRRRVAELEARRVALKAGEKTDEA
jgi:hypothetical protein